MTMRVTRRLDSVDPRRVDAAAAAAAAVAAGDADVPSSLSGCCLNTRHAQHKLIQSEPNRSNTVKIKKFK